MTIKLNSFVFNGFLFLVLFDFLTKDIFINFSYSMDGIKVQIYKFYIFILFAAAVTYLYHNPRLSMHKNRILKNIMLLWALWGMFSVPIFFIHSPVSLRGIVYMIGDTVGWLCIPVFFLTLYVDFQEEKILWKRLKYFVVAMRALVIIGLLKFVFFKSTGVPLIPMGLPIYFLYLSILIFMLFDSRIFGDLFKYERKNLTWYLPLIIFLLLIYAQRTQIIILLFIFTAFYVLYSHQYLKKLSLLLVIIFVLYLSIMFLPETIHLKFTKILSGSGTTLPTGITIPFISLDNSLTQRVFESFDVLSTIGEKSLWITGGGNGFSFESELMQRFKEEKYIHHVHISYFAILLRVGLVGLALVFMVMLWATSKSFKKANEVKILSVTIMSLAIDYCFFQRFYYSFEFPLTLALMVIFLERDIRW